MGVKHLQKFFRQCKTTTNIDNYNKNHFFAIDFIYFIYHGMIQIHKKKRTRRNLHYYFDKNMIDPHNNLSGEEKIKYEEEASHIIALYSFIRSCVIDKNILICPVIDGKTPTDKKKRIEERRKDRQKFKKKCDKIVDKTSNEFIKYHQKCINLTSEKYNDIMFLLSALGIPFIRAVAEADHQCAVLFQKSLCKGIIADDLDILLIGGKSIITDFQIDSNVVNELHIDTILDFLKTRANKILTKYNLPNIKEFTHLQFVDFCIINGTDYNEEIKILNNKNETHEKLFEVFVLNNRNIYNFLNYIKNDNANKWIIPKNFIESWTIARKNFSEGTVIDPNNIRITIKYPEIQKIIQILHYKYKFKIEFINIMYKGLIKVYNKYYGIKKYDWYDYTNMYKMKKMQLI